MSTTHSADKAASETPKYGDFGHTQPTNAAPANNSGHNDNPDEFSEFRKPNRTGTEDYSPEAEAANPAEQPGHVEQNQDTAAVRAAQGKDDDVQRAAWADDDPRYGSGHDPAAPGVDVDETNP